MNEYFGLFEMDFAFDTWMEGRKVFDVAIFLQFLHTLMVCCDATYLCYWHNFVPGNIYRIFKIVFIPAFKQCHVKTYMPCINSVVGEYGGIEFC